MFLSHKSLDPAADRWAHPAQRTDKPGITTLLLLLDPDGTRDSADEARQNRRVLTRVLSPHTGELIAVLPLHEIAAIAARLDAAVETARAARDPRTPAQIRADTLSSCQGSTDYTASSFVVIGCASRRVNVHLARPRGARMSAMESQGRVLVLWDIDHTLIENGGVSKANYALAFELLTGQQPQVAARTDGRTDADIMPGLFRDNGVRYPENQAEVLSALAEAGRQNAEELSRRGHALEGAVECLQCLSSQNDVINSVLTGNIVENARIKLGVFGLDKWVDFSVGAFGAEHRVRSALVQIAQEKARVAYGFDPGWDVTVVVGDTKRDVTAGRDGGARVIAVATGMDSREDLDRSGADVALASLVDVSAFCRAVNAVRALGPLRSAVK